MGVLECDRPGCTNIMCDRVSYTYGYICEDCFGELVKLGPNVDLDKFFEIPNAYEPIDYELSYSKYNELFPSRFKDE